MAMLSSPPCPHDRRAPTRAEPEAGNCQPAAPATAQRRWRSSEIFGKAQVVEIEHGESVYRLRLTTMGKLILTK